ncbi:MAG TPA: GMP synthase [Deltaproteobacteria bacterium]|nr:GMP synthase [Deltaproteobacteria bacterium]
MERTIVIIKHVENEGPGFIGEFFKTERWGIKTIELWKHEPLPDSLDNIAAVVMLGGPMNVYEEERYPFLKEEDRFITKLIIDGIPFLGVCLGAQLLAKSCGGKVIKAPKKEMGWYEVTLTNEGKHDTLFQGSGKRITVFQWHEDTFLLPDGIPILARGKRCKNQAFRIGDYAYGLQFHIEVTYEMVKVWMKDEMEKEGLEKILKDTNKIIKKYRKESFTILQNFKRCIELSLYIRDAVNVLAEDMLLSDRKRSLFWIERSERAIEDLIE